MVQTICIDIDDLSEFEVVDEINVFVKSFDFEGKQTRGRIECLILVILLCVESK